MTKNDRGETPIQANRRLCAEAGVDTLPARAESWCRNMKTIEAAIASRKCVTCNGDIPAHWNSIRCPKCVHLPFPIIRPACPMCGDTLSQLAAVSAPSCPNGCTPGEHHHNAEHRRENEEAAAESDPEQHDGALA